MTRAPLRRSPLRAALLAAACVVMSAGAAHADPFDDCIVADEATLADARGGFVSAGGVAFDLGAVITTWQNGAVALQTVLSWTPGGPQATHAVGAPAGGDVLASAQPALTANGGVAIVDPNGATTILHMANGGAFTNAIVTADSNQIFAQDIAITLTLPGFDSLQAGFASDRMAIRLATDLGDMLASARN